MSTAAAASSLRRDVQVISLVSAAHGLSHFYQLVLPPLFPVFRDELGVPYVALGLVMSVFYTTSAIGQTAAGFLVDRVGARAMLLAGLGGVSTATALASAVTDYWMLVAVAVLAGLGNCVFHPCDYAILNAAVSPARLGRAYGTHSLCGNAGWILAPALIAVLASHVGWRGALLTVGVGGLVATGLLASQTGRLPDHRASAEPGPAGSGGLAASARLLATAPILMAFAYFTLLSMALVGLQTFGVAAMVTLYGVALGFATSALTGYLLGNAVGILMGGALADRVRRHEVVAVSGLALAALFALVLASGALPGAWLPLVMGLTGLAMGITQPSRDLIVRSATPTRAAGKVFGFVYAGLDLGATVTPLAFGWLLDRDAPRFVFVISAALMVVTMATVLRVRGLTVARAPA